MKGFRHVILLAAFAISSIAQETYVDPGKLCSECNCYESSNNKTLYVNCTARQIQYVPADWPDKTKSVVATFSQNAIPRLGQFPGTNATLKLVFDHCGVEELASGLFESSINIVYLDLSHNKITSDQLKSDVFKGPYNATSFEPIALEHLDLAYNEIHSLHQSLFEHLPNLKHLNLEGNNFRVLDDVTTLAFSSIPQLQDFNIANNRLVDVSDNALVSFRNLTKLNVSNNELDFLPLSLHVVQFTLEVLDVSNNPIRVFDDETFLGMASLIELSARNLTELERIKTNTFAPLKRLRKLDLSHNRRLRQIDEQAFLQSEALKELYLRDTKLSSLADNVLNWTTLMVLDLGENQLFCDCNLYNISTLLPEMIKRDKNGPYCKDIRTSFSLEVYTLTSDVCAMKRNNTNNSSVWYYANMTIVRMSLVALAVVLIFVSFIAIIVGYTKWRTWQRSRAYPFATSIIYNPIPTNNMAEGYPPITSVDGKMKLLRMSLVLLTAVLIVTSFIGVMLAYARWKSWKRNRSYPFASGMAYDPLTPNIHL